MSNPPFTTGALVTDCVDGTGEGTEDLNIPNWLASGAPSLAGVRYLGSVHHQGRNATGQITYPSTEDIDFDHEAELTASGRYLLATDERGGGVTPPGATCMPGADNTEGNGGVHAYDVSKLQTTMPTAVPDAWKPYARTSSGAKAIYRAQVRTKPQATVCTAHVMHQIPGQNRIFMAWYSQGTQVIDFTENRDGTLDFKEAGWFIPAQLERVGVGRVQGAAEQQRHVHLLRRDGRLQPRRGGPQHDRRLQGHAAGAPEAAREVARAAGASR